MSSHLLKFLYREGFSKPGTQRVVLRRRGRQRRPACALQIEALEQRQLLSLQPFLWNGAITINVNAFRITAVTVAGAGDPSSAETIGTRVSPFLGWIRSVTGIVNTTPTATLPFSDGVCEIETSPSASVDAVLEQNGTLWTYDGFAWLGIKSNVQSFSFGSDDMLYALQSGILYQCNPNLGNWSPVADSVQSFGLDSRGLLYVLESGTLYQCNPSVWNWSPVADSVQSFGLDNRGLLYVLKSGNLYHCDPAQWNWTEVNSQVQSFAIGSDGKLYANKVDGSYWRYDAAARWIRLS